MFSDIIGDEDHIIGSATVEVGGSSTAAQNPRVDQSGTDDDSSSMDGSEPTPKDIGSMTGGSLWWWSIWRKRLRWNYSLIPSVLVDPF